MNFSLIIVHFLLSIFLVIKAHFFEFAFLFHFCMNLIFRGLFLIIFLGYFVMK